MTAPQIDSVYRLAAFAVAAQPSPQSQRLMALLLWARGLIPHEAAAGLTASLARAR